MTDELSSEPIELTVDARAHGWRIDHYLSRLYSNYSRALFQKAIEQKHVLVNGVAIKPSRRLRINDRVSVRLPELPDQTVPAENIPLDVLYEDEAIIVLNKAANMIVHPGKGNYSGTLAGALQYHFDQLSDVAGQLRPGIVHRLDRDTTGVLVIAKDNRTHHKLSRQFEERSVQKEYRAIVWGEIEFDSDYIETHLRVHPKNREKMQVCSPSGNARNAKTFYEVLERFAGFSFVRLKLFTGRTHQLRVHMQHLGHPIVADKMYGGRAVLRDADLDLTCPKNNTESTAGSKSAILIARQALHAHLLQFVHPASGKVMSIEAPWPEDFERTLTAMRSMARE